MNGIILAGGNSSRISLNKAFIKMGRTTIIENTIAIFKDLFSETIIVTNKFEDYQHFGVKLIADVFPKTGPLGGIYSGLTFSNSDYNFIAACDMPFIDLSIIKYLQRYTIDNVYDVITPEYNGFIEPLFAIYSKNCLNPVKSSLEQNCLKIRDFFTRVKVKEVSCNKFISVDKCFFNINTKDDLNMARVLDCG